MARKHDAERSQFADEFRRVLDRSGLAVGALAQRINVSVASVYAYRDGTSLPPVATLDRIGDALGLRDEVRDRLRDLHEAARNGPPPVDGPVNLPYRPQPFIGREAELDQLSAWADGSAPVVLSAVAGTAGVGKTALALNWAYQHKDRYPDGHLYLDLRGYDPGSAPMPVVEALGILLAALRVGDIPLTRADRESVYRAATARRRLLLLLDNASSAEQVRPLLPGGEASFVIVTSRDALAGLSAREGARRIVVDLLPLEESLRLMRAIVGDARVDTDPAAVERIVELCARLPLALRLAAEVLVARPVVPLSDLAEELADEQRRLDQLDVADDPLAGCRSVFSWSYGHLPTELQRRFRLLGLSPGAHHDEWGLAALSGADRSEAGRSLWSLARASLVQERRARRFEMHTLLRVYGKELAVDLDDDRDRTAAVRRLADHYVASSAAAAEVIFGPRVRRVIGPVPSRKVPPLPDRPAALAWMNAEYPNVVAACQQAREFELTPQVQRLSETMNRFLGSQGLWSSMREVHQAALDHATNAEEAADARHNLAMMFLSIGENERALELHDEVIATRRALGDRSAEAAAVGNKGLSLDRLGRYEEALDHHRAALRLALETGNATSVADGYGNLGNTLDALTRYDEALDAMTSALDRYTEIEDDHGAARTLNNMGVISHRRQDWSGALTQFRAALALKMRLGDRANEGSSRVNIGLVLAELGQHEDALIEMIKAEKVARDAGDANHRASILNNLSSLRAKMGDLDLAIEGHGEALALATAARDRGLEAEIRNDLGETLTQADRARDAVEHHRIAGRLATESGDHLQRERAHVGLAHARRALDPTDPTASP